MSEKISFETFLKSKDCISDTPNRSYGVFEEKAERRADFTLIILLIITLIAIAACVIYCRFSYSDIKSDYKVSGTYVSDYNSMQSENTSGKININTADISSLCTLNGIGESKAFEIISYRTANGSFKSIDELKNVDGIGDATFEKIRDSITV